MALTKSRRRSKPSVDEAPLATLSRRRLWLLRLLASVCGPLVFFVLLEGGLRAGGYGYASSFLVPIEGRDAMQTNPAFGWRFFHPTVARRPLVAEIAVPKPSGTYRVVVLGGSAAMGIPDPSFSFGRILREMLAVSELGAVSGREVVEVEVVNAAMTAINSHVVLEIARDIGQLEPDAVIVYMGNNEVVGPWGVGSGGGTPPSLGMIRAAIRLRATRIGQLGSAILTKSSSSHGWRGMSQFKEHRLGQNDPGLDQVYSSFETNLRDILKQIHKADALAVVVTPAVDILDTPPFASLTKVEAELPGGLGEALKLGEELLERGELGSALKAASRAVEIDGFHAGAHYLRGRIHFEWHQLDQARVDLEAARDLDGLRFRADSKLQRLVREVSEQEARKSGNVVWVDFPAQLAAASPHGVAGAQFFWEHVHLNFAGNYQLAKAVAESWPRLSAPSLGLARWADALAYTPWHAGRQAQEIDSMMRRPPFTSRQSASQQLRDRLLELGRLARRSDAAALAAALEASGRRLERRPQDLLARLDKAQMLLKGGLGEEAVELLQQVTRRIPAAPGPWLDLGNALVSCARWSDAEQAYEQASQLDPFSSDVSFNRGVLAVRRELWLEAVTAFRLTLTRDAGHRGAALNLAAALERLGEPAEAIRALRQAVAASPEDPVVLGRLASALAQAGEAQESLALSESVVQKFPEHAAGYFDLAVVYAGLGRHDEAVRLYAASLRLDPEGGEARDNLVALHNQRAAELAASGQWNEAITLLHKALAVHPDHAPSHYNLALMLGRSGRREQAVDRLQQALRLARETGMPLLAAEIEPRLEALGVLGPS